MYQDFRIDAVTAFVKSLIASCTSRALASASVPQRKVLSPLVKRSLAMVQPDPLRTPPQAPPQPQYPNAQPSPAVGLRGTPAQVGLGRTPTGTGSITPMSQVGQPMHGAAPAVNAHGGPAMAGQIGTPGTGLDAPNDSHRANVRAR